MVTKERDGLRTEENLLVLKQRFDKPATVLALALIPVLLLPSMVEVSSEWASRFEVAGWIIWGLFVFEYVSLLVVAPDRWAMVKDHPLELALILVPVFRPLRLLRAVPAIAKAIKGVRRNRATVFLQSYLLVLVLVIFGGATITYLAERGDEGSNLDSFGDALWWTAVTTTTVGYGDHYPITAQGRAVALVLMVLGVGLLSVVTANVAAQFVDHDAESEVEEFTQKLLTVEAKLDQVLTRLDNLVITHNKQEPAPGPE